MPRATRYDFRGGVSRKRYGGQNQVYELHNARPSPDGVLTVRKGRSLYATAGSASSGAIKACLARKGAGDSLRVYSVKYEDGTNDKIYEAGTELTGTSFGVGDTITSIDVYKGTIFFSNGKTPINYHVPSTAVVAEITGTPTPPKGRHMLFYKDRCYVADNNNDLYHSNAGMYTTLPTCDFPALNHQTVGSSGEIIMGMRGFRDRLHVFGQDGYYVMSGAPDDDGGLGDVFWRNVPGIGCLSSRSITLWTRGVIFFSSDIRIRSAAAATLIDLDPMDNIKEYLDGVSESDWENIACDYYQDEIWVYLPTGNTLIYNPRLNCWSVFTNIDGYAFAKRLGTTKFFVGSASSGKVWQQENGDDDDGTLIPFKLVSAPEVLGTLRKPKFYELASVHMDLRTGDSIDIKYRADNASSGTAFSSGTPLAGSGNKTWGEETWGTSPWATQGYSKTRVYFSGGDALRARELRLEASGNVKAGVRFLSYELEGRVDERED